MAELSEKLTTRLQNVINIYAYAIEHNTSIKAACIANNLHDNYISDFKKRTLDDLVQDHPNNWFLHEYYRLKELFDNGDPLPSGYQHQTPQYTNTQSDPSGLPEKYSQKLQNSILIYQYALDKNISLKSACIENGFLGEYVKDVKKDVIWRVEQDYPDNELLLEFNRVRNEYDGEGVNEQQSKNGSEGTYKTKGNSHNSDIDEKFDERSKGWAERDPITGKILKYRFRILVRDNPEFTGEISREQMDQCTESYPYLSLKTVSLTVFPFWSLIEVRRVFRVFNILKTSYFSQHVLEERTPEEISIATLKAKERHALNRIIENKPVFIEKELRQLQVSYQQLLDERNWVKRELENIISSNPLKPVTIEYKPLTNNRALIIYLSDLHVGACNDKAQFSKDYNEKVYYSRLKQILQEVYNIYVTYHTFENIFVVNLGDAMDGYDGQTCRKSHPLDQNEDNRMQFKIFVESMIFFFEELHKLNISNNINYITVGDDNHAGDFGYVANQSLKYIFELKYPDVHFHLAEKVIEHFTYGNHSFIFTHGKDKHLMKSNLPLTLNAQTDNFFVNYIKQYKLYPTFRTVVKADLHQYSTQIGKNFRYTNTPSLYGGSSWTDLNFGPTVSAALLSIVEKERNIITDCYLELD